MAIEVAIAKSDEPLVHSFTVQFNKKSREAIKRSVTEAIGLIKRHRSPRNIFCLEKETSEGPRE